MNKKGFTLVELIVVIAIGAIVSAVIGRAILSNFTNYNDMSITQVQSMSLNGVNEILNNQIEDAMSVAVKTADSPLASGEYGIYTDTDGNLLLTDSDGNVSTLYTNDTGAVNILELYVQRDTNNLDQVQFILTYTDGSSEIMSKTLTTQLMNNKNVNYSGYAYEGDNNVYLLRDESTSNILVYKKALTSGVELTEEQKIAILSYYLSDPDYTPDTDPQTYIYGMLYWDEDHYEIFNNTSIIQYGDTDATDLAGIPDYEDMWDYPELYISDPVKPLEDLLATESNNTYKVRDEVIVYYGGQYWQRTYPSDGAAETDIEPGNLKFKVQGWVPLTYPLMTDLSSEDISTISYTVYDPDKVWTREDIGTIFFAGTSLYMYAGTDLDGNPNFVELDDIFNSDDYDNLIVDKDAVLDWNIEDFDATKSYSLGSFVAATGSDGQTSIYEKVLDVSGVSNPTDNSQRLAGGWQLKMNQYDPYSNYVNGDQMLVFGDNDTEVFIVTVTGDVNSAEARADLNYDIEACFKYETSTSITTEDYTIAPYVF